jgi:hypothetical protein
MLDIQKLFFYYFFIIFIFRIWFQPDVLQLHEIYHFEKCVIIS